MNPNDEKGTIQINEDLVLFDKDIADGVPNMFRTLVKIWACQVLLAFLFISRPKRLQLVEGEGRALLDLNATADETPLKDSDKYEGKEIIREYDLVNLRAAFKSKRFGQYFAMMFLANYFGGFFSYFYKPIGVSVNISDKLLSIAGSLAALG